MEFAQGWSRNLDTDPGRSDKGAWFTTVCVLA